MGKKRCKVTTVDFSPSAIKAAKALSEELNIEAKFIESNVLTLDLKQELMWYLCLMVRLVTDLNNGEQSLPNTKTRRHIFICEFTRLRYIR